MLSNDKHWSLDKAYTFPVKSTFKVAIFKLFSGNIRGKNRNSQELMSSKISSGNTINLWRLYKKISI